MEKILFKLKCRNCNDILKSSDNEEKTCSCGNCTFSIKDNKVYVGSKNYLGGFIIYTENDDAYILVSKKDLEESNG